MPLTMRLASCPIGSRALTVTAVGHGGRSTPVENRPCSSTATALPATSTCAYGGARPATITRDEPSIVSAVARMSGGPSTSRRSHELV